MTHMSRLNRVAILVRDDAPNVESPPIASDLRGDILGALARLGLAAPRDENRSSPRPSSS